MDEPAGAPAAGFSLLAEAPAGWPWRLTDSGWEPDGWDIAAEAAVDGLSATNRVAIEFAAAAMRAAGRARPRTTATAVSRWASWAQRSAGEKAIPPRLRGGAGCREAIRAAIFSNDDLLIRVLESSRCPLEWARTAVSDPGGSAAGAVLLNEHLDPALRMDLAVTADPAWIGSGPGRQWLARAIEAWRPSPAFLSWCGSGDVPVQVRAAAISHPDYPPETFAGAVASASTIAWTMADATHIERAVLHPLSDADVCRLLCEGAVLAWPETSSISPWRWVSVLKLIRMRDRQIDDFLARRWPGVLVAACDQPWLPAEIAREARGVKAHPARFGPAGAREVPSALLAAVEGHWASAQRPALRPTEPTSGRGGRLEALRVAMTAAGVLAEAG